MYEALVFTYMYVNSRIIPEHQALGGVYQKKCTLSQLKYCYH